MIVSSFVYFPFDEFHDWFIRPAITNHPNKLFSTQSGAGSKPIVTYFNLVFPRLALVACFSRAWHRLYVFPRLARVKNLIESWLVNFPLLLLPCPRVRLWIPLNVKRKWSIEKKKLKHELTKQANCSGSLRSSKLFFIFPSCCIWERQDKTESKRSETLSLFTT